MTLGVGLDRKFIALYARGASYSCRFQTPLTIWFLRVGTGAFRPVDQAIGKMADIPA